MCSLSLHFETVLLCLHTHVCASAHGGQRFTSDTFPSHSPPDFSRLSFTKPEADQFSWPCWLESQRVLLSLLSQHCDYRCLQPVTAVSIDAGDLNSSPHADIASAFPAKPSSWPRLFFVCGGVILVYFAFCLLFYFILLFVFLR